MDAPLLSSSVNRTQEPDEERREDEGHVPSATFVYPRNSDNVLTSPPGRPTNTPSPHTTYPLNNNERTYSMLDPNAQLRVIHAWMSAMRQVASLRDIILTARMDIKRERTRCSQQEEFFQSLMDPFMALLNSAIEQGSYLQYKNELDDLSRKMIASREDLKMLRKRSSGMEDGLSNQEYQLTKLEEDLYQQIDTEYQHNSIQPMANSPRTSVATEMQAKANDNKAPPSPRDELYSRMGDLRILLDRLNDFEYELRQELDERDILRATGQIHISDDTAFFEETRNERAKLQEELEDAQADVERLKQLCIRKGIEFEDVQFHNPFYPDTEVDETYSRPSTQAEAAILPPPGSPSDILSTFFSTQERVENWLKDPCRSEPTLTGAAEREGEDRARTESRLDADWVIPCGRSGWPRHGRLASLVSCSDDEKAQYGVPMQTSGAPVSSELMEVLLKDSMKEPTSNIRRHRRLSHVTV